MKSFVLVGKVKEILAWLRLAAEYNKEAK